MLKTKFLHSQGLKTTPELELLRQQRSGRQFNELHPDEQKAVIDCYLQSFNWIDQNFIRQTFADQNPFFRPDYGHWIFCKGGEFENFWKLVYEMKGGAL